MRKGLEQLSAVLCCEQRENTQARACVAHAHPIKCEVATGSAASKRARASHHPPLARRDSAGVINGCGRANAREMRG
jgi:hypothetical protein